ncbi:MAG: hypothetical protein LBF12_03040 [Christensenellaceae bacterium]|jgi:putative sterol carrier protein|nr:hypothetical protein [Christensenellaceae bacterium]
MSQQAANAIKTQAYVNFYAAIGALEKFVELDEWAQQQVGQTDLSIWFNVKDGPDGLLELEGGSVRASEYVRGVSKKPTIRLYCNSPAKFNDVIANKAMPIPLKGLSKTLKFMGKPDSPFMVLTNEMASIMRSRKRLDGTEEEELGIKLAFYAMAAALAQVGNHDRIGKLAGARIHEGEISMEIKDAAAATIIKADGKLTCKFAKSEKPRAYMIFDSLETAGLLINGEIDAMSCLASGKLVMKGFIPMLEDLNKILNIVPKYLS